MWMKVTLMKTGWVLISVFHFQCLISQGKNIERALQGLTGIICKHHMTIASTNESAVFLFISFLLFLIPPEHA